MRQKTWILLMMVLLASGLTLTLAGNGHGGSWNHEGGIMFIHEEGTERFDVSDLEDGETRIFGTGAKQITATRNGNVVTLSRDENDDARMIEILCDVNDDNCAVMVSDDGASVAIMVQKTSGCAHDGDDCHMNIEIGDLADGHGMARVLLERLGDCGGSDVEECHRFEVLRSEASAGQAFVIRSEGAGGNWVQSDGNVIMLDGVGEHIFIASDELTLRCPEGDTTTTINKDLQGQTFLCPQHSVPLEEVKMPAIHRFMIERLHENGDASGGKNI